MDQARERLTKAMDERRRQLGLKWADVARRADGMSQQHLLRIRKDQVPVTPEAAASIEHALEWTVGSAEVVLAGGEPTLLAEAGMPTDPISRARRASIIAATPEQLAEMYQMIDEVMGPERAREFLAGALELRAAHRTE